MGLARLSATPRGLQLPLCSEVPVAVCLVPAPWLGLSHHADLTISSQGLWFPQYILKQESPLSPCRFSLEFSLRKCV